MFITEKDFQGFTGGNEKSFEAIFRQYYKTLVSFAMRYGLDRMESEDVVIEVFHHIWEIRSEMKSPAALNVLLYTSVYNRALNAVRNYKNRERLIQNCEICEEEEGFYDAVADEEISRLLDEAVENLPGKCRIVIMKFLEGKTGAEISEEMGISINTVKTYKMRAIEILRVKLSDYPLVLWIFLMRVKSDS